MSTTFYIEGRGCTHITADIELMTALLHNAKFSHAPLEEAYVIILHNCAVQGKNLPDLLKRMEEIKAADPYRLFILTGCTSGLQPEKFKSVTLVGSRQLHRIVEAVEERLNNNIVHILQNENDDAHPLPPLLRTLPRNKVVSVVPLSRGCVPSCLLCKHTGWEQVSYPSSQIVQAVHHAISEGAQEIWLTAHDTFAYGTDNGTSLPQLLRELAALSGEFKILLERGNPGHLARIGKELLPLLGGDKIFQFLHFGAVMEGGKEQRQEMLSYVEELRREMPSSTLVLDVAIGDEQDEEHWQITDWVRKMAPEIINFLPPQKMNDIVQHRVKVLGEIAHNIAILQNEKWKGWEGSAVIEEKKGENRWVARNDAYKHILLEGEYQLGQRVKVKITKIGQLELVGEAV